MAYGDEETMTDMRASAENERDLPDGFPFTGRFDQDSATVAHWAELEGADFELAFSRLTVTDLRVAISLIGDVNREHRNHIERASALGDRLREAVNRVAHHGLADQKEAGY